MLQICCRYACVWIEMPQVRPWRPAYCKVGSSKNLCAPEQFVCVLGFLGRCVHYSNLFHTYLPYFEAWSGKSSKPKFVAPLVHLCKVPVLVFWKTLADWLRVRGEEVRSVKTSGQKAKQRFGDLDFVYFVYICIIYIYIIYIYIYICLLLCFVILCLVYFVYIFV